MEAAHALSGLACSSYSRLHIGRGGGVDLLYKMLKENLVLLSALDAKFESGEADAWDYKEFDEVYENLRICLVAALNLSVEQEFHVSLAKRFLKCLVEFAQDDEESIFAGRR